MRKELQAGKTWVPTIGRCHSCTLYMKLPTLVWVLHCGCRMASKMRQRLPRRVSRCASANTLSSTFRTVPFSFPALTFSLQAPFVDLPPGAPRAGGPANCTQDRQLRVDQGPTDLRHVHGRTSQRETGRLEDVEMGGRFCGACVNQLSLLHWR